MIINISYFILLKIKSHKNKISVLLFFVLILSLTFFILINGINYTSVLFVLWLFSNFIMNFYFLFDNDIMINYDSVVYSLYVWIFNYNELQSKRISIFFKLKLLEIFFLILIVDI